MPSSVLMSIENVDIGDRFRNEAPNVDELAESIDRVGLLYPILVEKGTGKLIDGLRRYRAFQKLEKDVISCIQIDTTNPRALEAEANNLAIPFTISQKVAIAIWYEQEIGKRQGKRTDKGQLLVGQPEVRPGETTRDAAARFATFKSEYACRLAKQVCTQGAVEIRVLMDAGEVTITDAASIAHLPHELQRQAAELLRSGKVRTLGAAARAIDPELMPDPKADAPAPVETPEDRTTPADAETTPAEPEEEDDDADAEHDLGDPVGTNGTPKRDRPAEPKSATQDHNGEPWPERAKPAVELMPELRKLGEHLRGCAEEVRRLKATPVGTFLDVDSIAGKVESAKNAVLGSLPYAVCPYCQGAGTAKGEAGLSICEGCKGGGWVTRNRYQNSPRHTEEMKAAGKL